MGRTTRYANPVNFIHWRDNLQLIVSRPMTLVGIIRILIDQALGTGTMNDYPVSGDIFWTSQQIYDATNEVMIDYYMQLGRLPVPVQLSSATFTVTTGTDIFPYDTTTIMVPTYVVLNTEVGTGPSGVTINQEYWASDVTKLEQWGVAWRSDTPAQPKWFILWDFSHIRCFNQPDKTYTYALYGVPWPTEIGTGTEDPTTPIDPLFKLAIAYKAAANILEATRPDIADAYMKESEELLLHERIHIRNNQTNNLRRLKPGVGSRFTDATIGAAKGVIQIGRKLS